MGRERKKEWFYNLEFEYGDFRIKRIYEKI